MIDISAWALADPLTVEQAACLWANVDPSSSSPFLASPETAAIAPRRQMLTGAIASGELKADTKTNVMASIGDHKKSLVTRADLMAFAESRKERPAFLFDTMLKSTETRPKGEPAGQQINKGGRPAEWDWDTFFLEIIRIANTPDGLPDTRAELAEIMRNWFVDECDDHPADTTLEDRIRPIYQYFEKTLKPDRT